MERHFCVLFVAFLFLHVLSATKMYDDGQYHPNKKYDNGQYHGEAYYGFTDCIAYNTKAVDFINSHPNKQMLYQPKLQEVMILKNHVEEILRFPNPDNAKGLMRCQDAKNALQKLIAVLFSYDNECVQ